MTEKRTFSCGTTAGTESRTGKIVRCPLFSSLRFSSLHFLQLSFADLSITIPHLSQTNHKDCAELAINMGVEMN